MKFSDLKAFVDIVEAGGLTAAAHRRGVTQPGLSRILRDLETRLQTQLLRRTGRGIELTPAGDAFLQFSSQTLAHFAKTQQSISALSKTLPRQLRLSVPLRIGRLLIPGLYRLFGAQLPETAVYVFEEPSERARKLLNSGELDVALTYRNTPTPDRDFVPIVTEELYAVGHPRDLGHENKPILAEDLCGLPMLLPSEGRYRDLIQSSFRVAGHTFPKVRELETAEGLLAFAAEAEGVAILPMSNVYQEVARGEVTARLIEGPAISRVVGVQFRTDMSKHATGPVLSVMRKAIRQARDQADWRAIRQGKSVREQTL